MNDDATMDGGLLRRAVVRPVLLAVLAGLILVLPGPTGTAAACDAVDVIGGGEGVTTGLEDCDDEEPGVTPTPTTTPEGTPITVRVGAVDEDGEACLGWNTVWIDEPHHAHEVLTNEVLDLNAWLADNGLLDEGVIAEGRLNGDGVDLLPDCPATQGIDPDVVRDQVVHELPVPDPTAQPGWALTGMPTYLEIGADTVYDQTLTGELLPVAVTVSGSATYHVDWGDGTTTTHTSSGGPYPDGDVVHTYAHAADEVEIVVTPVWELEWSAAGLTMPLEIVLEPATYQLPVRELQSVRTSP